MSRHVPRILVDSPLEAGMDISLSNGAAHHLKHVLRIRTGDPVCLFNGHGGEYPARVIETTRHGVRLRIEGYTEVDRESPLRIELGQGIARGERMDFTIQKAVELGVDGIQPLHTDKSQHLPEERLARKLEHWRGVARSAAEQSGRTRLPAIREPIPLSDWLVDRGKEFGTGLCLVLAPDAATGLGSLQARHQVCLLIGPEAGLSEAELAMADDQGFKAINLGPRVLRTETAGLTVIAALQALWGDLG